MVNRCLHASKASLLTLTRKVNPAHPVMNVKVNGSLPARQKNWGVEIINYVYS